MKITAARPRTTAFTVVDLIIVIATIVLLLGVLSALTPSPSGGKAHRIRCVSNLKQVGLAFRLFANDHDAHYPFAVLHWSNTQTGVLLTSNSTTARVWMHFQALSNELIVAKCLACPSDPNRWNGRATDFANTSTSLSYLGNRDLAVSYLIGLRADEARANAILAADRNLTSVPGGRHYSSRQSGGAIQVSETSLWTDAWPPPIHGTQGNVALADGSVQQMTTQKLQQQLALATNAYGTNINLFLFPQ